MRSLSFLLILLVVAVSCNQPVAILTGKTPPYSRYVKSLEKASLDKTVMAQAWMTAGARALQDSLFIPIPFAESGYFQASEPDARSYRFNIKEGQVLTINGALVAKENTNVFLELFEQKEGKWVHLADADSSLNLTYEFNQDKDCLVRLQPELLVTAYYTLSISTTPILLNPVAGATNKSIGSFYGDSRDGGKRSHEGVDIFAKKGTPIIAPAAGKVTRVETSKLGGKVVWVQDQKRGHAYYFAHLDEQLVRPGKQLNAGDTIGTVGNTGNARFTPPHLHFGIYQSKSKDPIHFIKVLEEKVNALPWDTTFTTPDFKVITKTTPLQTGPHARFQSKVSLAKDTYVKVIGESSGFYRVQLPNLQQGFIIKDNIKAIAKGKRLKLKHHNIVLSDVSVAAIPIAHLRKTDVVEVLAFFNSYQFVRTREGVQGWLPM